MCLRDNKDNNRVLCHQHNFQWEVLEKNTCDFCCNFCDIENMLRGHFKIYT